MYEYIKGIFKGINLDYIVLENNDIGYKIFSSGNTMSYLPSVNEKVTLHILQIVRDDFIGLYGFYSVEELELFQKLLTVNGVGAKAALSLLSVTTVSNLKNAIVSGEYKLLMKAPGVGSKIAQRIILELKDKIEVENCGDENSDLQKNKVNCDEACEALKALGYNEKEIEKAMKNLERIESVEDTIKECLKFLMN